MSLIFKTKMSTVLLHISIVPELQGDPEEVAIEKVNIAYQQVKKPVLV
jgi:hypothetical protein